MGKPKRLKYVRQYVLDVGVSFYLVVKQVIVVNLPEVLPGTPGHLIWGIQICKIIKTHCIEHHPVITPFKYNDDICTSRGDKACYIVGDSVILNIAKGYKELEIYKDSALYKTIDVGNNLDIVLRDLAYGDYKARLVKGKKRSDCTYWKVIDTKVSIDQKRNIVKFHSENATPVFVEFCTSTGGRPTKGVFDLSNENIKNGYVDVSSFSSKLKRSRYVKVHFKCDYGRVINKPIKWRIK